MSKDMLKELFGGDLEEGERFNKAAAAEKFENYKDALQASIDKAQSGQYVLKGVEGHKSAVRMAKAGPAKADVDAMMERLSTVVTKGSEEDAAVLKQLVDVAKDWQVGIGSVSPNPSAQPVPYDLQTPLKELVPLHTPLLNDLPSVDQGEGLATHWKQLDALEGAFNSGNSNYLAPNSPFFSSQSTTNNFGSLSLRRPAKITYSTSDHTASYVEWGRSDLVADVAQYAGQGFANILQLSRHALSWTHLLSKERAVLYARGGTGNGYLGSVGAMGTVTPSSSSSGGSIGAATYYIKVTAVAGFGESAPSTEVNTGALTGSTNTITVKFPAVTGAVAYNIYVGTASGGETFQQQVLPSSTSSTTGYTLTTYSTTGAAAPSSDGSFDANGFDGLIPNTLANGGYVNTTGTTWTGSSNPGNELQTAFQSMWLNNFATPSEIWMDVTVKVGLGTALQKSGNSLAYRIQMSQTDGVIGTAVTGIQNLSSPNDEMVRFRVHPFMPKGVVLLRSPHLPFPANGVTHTAELRMVQGLLVIDWPHIQLTRDSSTYEFGTMIHYAPAWNGIFTGVTVSAT
jgi:hypothetical protein